MYPPLTTSGQRWGKSDHGNAVVNAVVKINESKSTFHKEVIYVVL